MRVLTSETDGLNMRAALDMTPGQWQAVRLSIGDRARFIDEFPALARDRDDVEVQLAKWLQKLRPLAEAGIIGHVRDDLKRSRKARAKTVKAWERFIEALEADRAMLAELHQSDALEQVHRTLAGYEDVPESKAGREPAPHILLAQWAAQVWRLPTPAIIRAIKAIRPITDDQAESIRVKLAGRNKSKPVGLNAAIRAWR